jgi:hypothetical protein
MKRLTDHQTRYRLLSHANDQINIPHFLEQHLTRLACGYFCVSSISPMHCKSEPVIGGCPSVNNQSKLLFIGTTPRTVREPMCDEVDCLQSRATLVTLVYIKSERAVTVT